MAGDPCAKYLARYAEPEARLASEVAPAAGVRYGQTFVVPARAEPAGFLAGLRAAAETAGLDGARILAIVVVNAPSRAARGEHETNARLLAELRGRFPAQATWRGETAADLLAAGPLDLLLVDRATSGRELPAREGVGLARKIGHDLGLALWARGAIASPWLHASDADAAPPADRLRAADEIGRRHANAVAIVHPFRHEPSGDSALDDATLFYEMSLRYRVSGLRWAESPYAWHAMGSALTVRAEAYAAVRGFPAREAGEDFHLLDKLAKLGAVVQAEGDPVRIAARISGRVPFGTGAAVARLLAERAAGEGWRLPHPHAFAALRAWLSEMREAAAADSPAREGVREETPARAVLEALGAPAAMARILDGRTPPSQRLRACHTWFDGLRTVRFLHGMRDRGAADLPWEQALAGAARLGMAAPFAAGEAPPLAGAAEMMRRADGCARITGLA